MLLIKYLILILIIIPLIFSKVIEEHRISEVDNNTKSSAKENSESYPISTDEKSTTITNKVQGHSETKSNKELKFLQEFLQVDVNKIKNHEKAKDVLIKYLDYYDARLKFDNFEIPNFDYKLKKLIKVYQLFNNYTLSSTSSYEDKLNDLISYYKLKNNVDSNKFIISFINSSYDDNDNSSTKAYAEETVHSIDYHDSKCGKQSDTTIYKCDNNLCCSSNGECGNTEEYCGTGCNPDYGICW